MKPTNITSSDQRELSSVIVPKSGNKDVEREHQNRINKRFNDRIEELEVSGGGTTVVGGGDGNHSTLTADNTNFVLTDSGDRNYHIDIKTGGIGSNELASTAVTPGSYGDDDQSPSYTVDADGRLTAAADVHIPITVYLTAGEALAASDFIGIDSSGEAILADATSVDTAAIGYVKSAFSSSATAKVYLNKGQLTGLSGLTAGKKYFLSSSTPGGIVAQPTLSGTKISQFLGTALSSTSLMVDIDEPYRLYSTLAISGAFTDTTQGTAMGSSLTVSGGVPPYSLDSYTAPTGSTLSLSTATITDTGTVTNSGTGQAWSVSVSDSAGAVATANGTVDVTAAATGSAPDEIANLTMWLDFTDSTTVFSDTPGTTPATPGGAIRSVTNKADSELWIKQNGAQAIWAENAVGSYEALETYLDEDCYFQCANGSYRNMDSYMSTSAGSLAFLVKMTGYNSTSTNYQAPTCGFRNDSGSYGIAYSTSNNAVHVIGNSGSSIGSVAAAQGDFHVIQLRHNGTNRQIRVDNGSWSNLGDGTVNWLNTKLIIGVNTPFTGDDGKLVMLHAVAYSSVLSDSDADDLRDWLLAHV